MDCNRSVNPSPQIRMLDIDPPAKMFPHESARSPAGQRIRKRSDQIAIAADQSHIRRTIDGLQPANGGQEREPIQIPYIVIVGGKDRCSVSGFQIELPESFGQTVRSRLAYQ
ncbi:MAG: hypothetical protein P8L85_12290 [Rubripirellula sp.]|nr:hypothetical protein [Rubripirellula sp.]